MTYSQNPENPGLPAAPHTSGMALASMILGILAILTAIIGVGLLLGIIGLILGIIALSAISRRPQELGGRGLAITGIITSILSLVVAPILLLIAILLPSLGRARELSNRAYCATNLRGIAQSMNVYAADNVDVFPVVPYAPYGPANYGITTGRGAPNSDDATNALYKSSAPEAGSPLAGAWILVLKNQTSPKQFVCKSDPWGKTPAALSDAGGAYFTNFQRDDQISYSFAYPYTSKGEVGKWWTNLTDSLLPIASDMAPLDGTGSPRRNLTTPMMPINNRIWSSANHQGDGQNVAFSDAHVEFTRRPDVGQNSDNIFTWGAAPLGGGVQFGGKAPGKAPISLGEKSPFDTVMVPARNLDTGGL
jgi:hypothetical protein